VVSRTTQVLLAVFLLLACGAAAVADADALGRAAVKQMATADLRGLARSSGLQDAPTPLPVFVQQEGGPLWVTDVLTDVVRDTRWLHPDPASHHRVHAEVVAVDGAWALRLSLWRQGWTLRNAAPQRVHVAPWVPTASAIAGAIAAVAGIRIGLGLAAAGLLAQLLVLALPGVPVPTNTALQGRAGPSDGPFGQWVVEQARMLPDASVAVGLGLVAVCLVLVALDHRRSREKGGAWVLWGLCGVAGMLAWVEAGARAGLLAYANTQAGLVGLLGLAGLWVWVVGHGRRWWGR
jgi:hypothetical protein